MHELTLNSKSWPHGQSHARDALLWQHHSTPSSKKILRSYFFIRYVYIFQYIKYTRSLLYCVINNNMIWKFYQKPKICLQKFGNSSDANLTHYCVQHGAGSCVTHCDKYMHFPPNPQTLRFVKSTCMIVSSFNLSLVKVTPVIFMQLL